MKIKFVLLILPLSIAFDIGAQKLTTFILVRHAEKVVDGSKDPMLTEDGKRRAERLALILRNTSVQAVYSTPFIRTRDTSAPVAKANALAITEYEAFKPEPIDKILRDFAGATVLMCGHSNNIPWIANYLTGTERFQNFDDNEYSNMLIITVADPGKVASVTWLNY